MKIQSILFGVLSICACAGCTTVSEPEPAAPPVSAVGTPPVDQGAPVTGGELFNGNY